MYRYYDNKRDGSVHPIIKRIRKTPKQKEKLKKLKLKERNLSDKADIAEKKLEKFKEKNKQIFSTFYKLKNNQDHRLNLWLDASNRLEDYEEKFLVRDTTYCD